MPFDIENTSSGKQREMPVHKGPKEVGRILGSGAPGNAKGFRPGGYGPGYDRVGGKSGMQVKIPNVRDQSKVKC